MKALWIPFLALTLVFAQGCAKRKMVADDPAGPKEPPRTGPGTSGGGIPLTLTAPGSDVQDFVLPPLLVYETSDRDMSTSSGFTMKLKVTKKGAGYGGEIRIGYTIPGGERREAVFTTKAPKDWCDYASCKENTQHNIWFTKNGYQIWHGFFQDKYGAVLVVIDQVNQGGGDGQIGTMASGRVYFKNFNPPNPGGELNGPTMGINCWDVYVGPYDCRTFLVYDPDPSQHRPPSYNYERDYRVVTTSSIDPEEIPVKYTNRTIGGYTELGRFNSLSILDSGLQ